MKEYPQSIKRYLAFYNKKRLHLGLTLKNLSPGGQKLLNLIRVRLGSCLKGLEASQESPASFIAPTEAGPEFYRSCL